MKNDLATSIIVCIVGVILAFFVCNMFVGEISPVSVKKVDSSIGIDIPNPDPELFNYKAVNPTVEVYVGDNEECKQYDEGGQCIYEDNQNTSGRQPGQGND